MLTGFAPSHQATHDTVILYRQPFRARRSLPPGNCLAVTARNPFITAYLKMNGGREEARRQAQAWLSPLQSHLTKQDWVISRRSSKGMRLIALEGVSLRLGAWPNLRVYSEELRACGRTHGHAFIQPKVKTGRRPHKHSRCSRSPSDPRIAPRELLDYQAIFRGARAPGRHLLQPPSGLSITRFVKSGGLRCYQFPFAFLSPEHC
jgi:hypothetical protein